MFIAKFFSGFGMIFSMKYYLMVVPFISDSRLVLYPTNQANGAIINTVLQLFLIIGGAWAVFKAQSLLLELLNPEAAQAEKQASALLTGAAMGAASMATGGAGAAVMGAMSAVGGAVSNGVQNNGAQNNSAPSPKTQSSQDESQAYRG